MNVIKQVLVNKSEPLKFAIVGASGVFVNLLVLYLTSHYTPLGYEVIYAIGIIISMTTNYILNRLWTFNSNKSILPEYLRFVFYNSIGAFIQWIVSVLIIRTINHASINFIIVSIETLYVASLIGIGFGYIFNFLASKFFVFHTDEADIQS